MIIHVNKLVLKCSSNHTFKTVKFTIEHQDTMNIITMQDSVSSRLLQYRKQYQINIFSLCRHTALKPKTPEPMNIKLTMQVESFIDIVILQLVILNHIWEQRKCLQIKFISTNKARDHDFHNLGGRLREHQNQAFSFSKICIGGEKKIF